MVTRSWLLAPGLYGLEVSCLSDVVRAYKVATRHRVTFVPVAMTYTIELRFAGCHDHTLCCDGEPAADETLRSIAQIATWALGGYSKELEQRWQVNRRELLKVVDERRCNQMGTRGTSHASE